MGNIDIVPSHPRFRCDWGLTTEIIDKTIISRLLSQQHKRHGEPWIRTMMACETLAESNMWRTLPENERRAVYLATLLHNISDATNNNDDGKVLSRRNLIDGMKFARYTMWQRGLELRSDQVNLISSLVLGHVIPKLNDLDDRRVILSSLATRNDLLAMVATTDLAGMKKDTIIEDNICNFKDLCIKQNCLNKPRIFASDHTRYMYFRGNNICPDTEVFDDTEFEFTMMCGVSAAGKDTWIAENMEGGEEISIDKIAHSLGLSHRVKKHKRIIIRNARMSANGLLQKHTPLVINDTSYLKSRRRDWSNLAYAHKARIKIVYIDTEIDECIRRAIIRGGFGRTGRLVQERLYLRMETPTTAECHTLDVVRKSSQK